MFSTTRTIATLAVVLFACAADAATRNGDLDPNFGIDGVQVVEFDGAAQALGLGVAPDGKIALGGTADNGPATGFDFAAARLNADGSIDTGFSFDGRVTVPLGAGNSLENVLGALVQGDGKIVVIGDARPTLPTDPTDMALVRFNQNGTLDTSFSGDGKAYVDFGLATPADDRALNGVQLPDGRLIVVGSAAVTGEESDFAVVKLNVDGSRDTSFDGDGRVTIRFNLDPVQRNELASSVAVDSSGRILIAGPADAAGAANQDFAIARLLPNGQLDNNFDGDGRASFAFDLGGNLDDTPLELIVAPDGAIFLTGAATDDGYDAAVIKLLPDGSPDAGFGVGGRVTVPFDLGGANSDIFYGAALQPDGALVLSGYVQLSDNNADLAFVRLLPDGALDPDFGFAGKSVIPLDVGGSLLDAATRMRYSDGAMVFAGAVATAPDVTSFLAGRLLIDVLFSDGYEND